MHQVCLNLSLECQRTHAIVLKRCPMECNIKRDSGPWSCQITLRKESDASNNRLPETRLLPFGPRIENPSEVEIMLRRAQAALLCPWMDQTAFVTMGPDELKSILTRSRAGSVDTCPDVADVPHNFAIENIEAGELESSRCSSPFGRPMDEPPYSRKSPSPSVSSFGPMPTQEPTIAIGHGFYAFGRRSPFMHHHADINVDSESMSMPSTAPLPSASSPSQQYPLKFSRNTICVEIKDPEAVNLSFVDLPGELFCPLLQTF